mgnify:CR=1 FL=1
MISLEINAYTFIIIILYTSVYAVSNVYLNVVMLKKRFVIESIWLFLKCLFFNYLILTGNILFLIVVIVKSLAALIVDFFDPNKFRSIAYPELYFIDSIKLYAVLDVLLFALNYFVKI